MPSHGWRVPRFRLVAPPSPRDPVHPRPGADTVPVHGITEAHVDYFVPDAAGSARYLITFVAPARGPLLAVLIDSISGQHSLVIAERLQ